MLSCGNSNREVPKNKLKLNMPTITESLHEIIKKQKELNYLFPLQGPANKNLINKVEKDLDLKFNDELNELYSIGNGVSDSDSSVEVPELIPTYTFLDLEKAVSHYKARIGFQDSFLNSETNFRPNKKLFPFLEDGAGNYYWVDLNENSDNYSKIFWTNTFGDNPDYQYSSLTNFFNVIAECYETNVITKDKEGYLRSDYIKYGQISQKYNPDLKYWNRYLNAK